MQSLEDLLPELLDATNAGRLKWPSISHDLAFTARIKDAEITVWTWHRESDDSTGYSLSLQVKGRTVDALQASEYSSLYSDVAELYSAARRSYHKVDAIIPSIRNALKEL